MQYMYSINVILYMTNFYQPNRHGHMQDEFSYRTLPLMFFQDLIVQTRLARVRLAGDNPNPMKMISTSPGFILEMLNS